MAQKVLFVDDEANVVESFKKAFHNQAFEVFAATSGQEALAIIEKEPIDVIVSDESMPGMSGNVLLNIVFSEHPDIVRIMLTGHASLDSAVRAINEGRIYRFLTKPCNRLELAMAITTALEQRALLVETRRLLEVTRQQDAIIRELEAAYPEIKAFHPSVCSGNPEASPTGPIDFKNLLESIKQQIEIHDHLVQNWM